MGPLPSPTGDKRRLRLLPGHKKWDRSLGADILDGAQQLRWMAEEVTFAELALDFELTV